RVNSYTAPNELKTIEERLEELQQEKEEAINTQNYEKAAEIRDLEKQKKEQLENTKEEWKQEKQSSNMSVGYEEIAKVVSDWTGVPVSRMTTEESERLLEDRKSTRLNSSHV